MKNQNRFFLITGVVSVGVGLVMSLLALVSCESYSSHVSFEDAGNIIHNRPPLLDAILSNEIVFYGRVLDLEGNPVPNAEIEYSSLSSRNFDRVWTGGIGYKRLRADFDGRFEIHDVGGSLFVNCTHPGYYGTDDQAESSQRKFSYGFQSGDDPAWDLQHPAIFRLRKKGVCEPLYYSCGKMINQGESWTRLDKGESIVINLAKGRRGESDTSVSVSYESDKAPEQREGYDWEYTLRIPGGGFIEKQKSFDFIAPEEGYKEEVKIGYKKTDEAWCRFKKGFYFVKFPNGLYGIFEIHAEPGKKGDFTFRALVNPNPDSRNLEYEYEKQINKNQRSGSYRGRL